MDHLKEYFTKKYFELRDQGFLDKEIAEKMGYNPNTIARWKKMYGITTKMVSSLGITEEELQKGESIGLPRRLIYQRVRSNNFTIEQAITIPYKQRRK